MNILFENMQLNNKIGQIKKKARAY